MKGLMYEESGLLKIPKSYWMGVAGSNSPDCCYISLDSGDKLSESLKAMEQCMEEEWYLHVLWLFEFIGFNLHTYLALPEPLQT